MDRRPSIGRGWYFFGNYHNNEPPPMYNIGAGGISGGGGSGPVDLPVIVRDLEEAIEHQKGSRREPAISSVDNISTREKPRPPM